MWLAVSRRQADRALGCDSEGQVTRRPAAVHAGSGTLDLVAGVVRDQGIQPRLRHPCDHLQQWFIHGNDDTAGV
jgi:hypothetical protein